MSDLDFTKLADQAQERYDRLPVRKQRLVDEFVADELKQFPDMDERWLVATRFEGLAQVEEKTLAQHIVFVELVRKNKVNFDAVSAKIHAAVSAIDFTEDRQLAEESINEDYGNQFVDEYLNEASDIDRYGLYNEARLAEAQQRVDKLTAEQQAELLHEFQSGDFAREEAALDRFLDLTMTLEEQRYAGLVPELVGAIDSVDDGGLEL